MTDYLSYTPAEYAPDAPATALHFQRWFENWIAGFEGAAGAPRLRGAAMFGPGAGSVVQRSCISSGSQSVSSNSTAASTERVYNSGFTALVACTVRVQISMTASGITGQTRLYKNNAIIQTWSASITNGTLDVTLAAGDTIAADIRAVGSSSGASGAVTLTKLDYQFSERSAVMT